MALSAPAPLTEEHRLADFRCSAPELADWLISRALKNHQSGASRCYVLNDDVAGVVGFYALAAGSVTHAETPGQIRRNMPSPIPVVVLGRLAVHENWAGQGIGTGLLKDALIRAYAAAEQIGVRALLCHALDDRAKGFYLKHGFVQSPVDDMTVMLKLR